MGRFNQPLFDSGFASGLVYYEDQYPGQDPTARIVLTVTVAGLHTLPAIVDTGAACACSMRTSSPRSRQRKLTLSLPSDWQFEACRTRAG